MFDYELLVKKLKENFKENEIISVNKILIMYKEIYNKELKNPYSLISRLISIGVITKLSKNKVILKKQKKYIINTTNETNNIYNEFKKIYPDIKIIVWDTSFLSDFMLHQVYNNIIVVEVPSYAKEITYTTILDKFGKKYSVLPSNVYSLNYMNYQINKVIVIKPLIYNAPVILNNKYYVPKVEKLLIDLYLDKTFYAYQGNELKIIFENIIDKHDLNLTTLFAYANKRNSNEEIKEYLKTLNIEERYKIYDK